MSDTDNKAAIIVMKAAGELRKVAVLDNKRYAELSGVADYLESIIHESELGYGDPLFPEPAPSASATSADEIAKLTSPFRVRLTR